MPTAANLNPTPGAPPTTNIIRNSFLSGATGSVRTLGSGSVGVFVGAQLDGGAGTSAGATGTRECPTVTNNSLGSETFRAGSSDPRP